MPSKGKILAVDDEEGITEYLQFLLQTEGFEVKTAGGGWEAWDLISAEPFDFVLTDVRMMRGDGIELVEKIRDMATPKPKVAIMSAFSDVSTSDVYERGAIGLVQKPPRSDRLITTVKNALRGTDELWKANPRSEPASITVKKTFATLDDALGSGVLSLGRGGMFLHIQDQYPVVDTDIAFELSFADNSAPTIGGWGVVRWVRPSCLRIFYTGVGIEFTELTDAARSYLLDFIETKNPSPYIPVGQVPTNRTP